MTLPPGLARLASRYPASRLATASARCRSSHPRRRHRAEQNRLGSPRPGRADNGPRQCSQSPGEGVKRFPGKPPAAHELPRNLWVETSLIHARSLPMIPLSPSATRSSTARRSLRSRRHAAEHTIRLPRSTTFWQTGHRGEATTQGPSWDVGTPIGQAAGTGGVSASVRRSLWLGGVRLGDERAVGDADDRTVGLANGAAYDEQARESRCSTTG